MLRLMQIPNLKFLILICDHVRWFDYELARNVLADVKERNLEEQELFTGQESQFSIQKIAQTSPDTLASVLADETTLANFPSSMAFLKSKIPEDRWLVLHADWLRESEKTAAYALQTLTTFLSLPQNSLAMWRLPKNSSRSKWKTDICNSPYLPKIKEILLSQNEEIGKTFFANRGLDVPARLVRGGSECDGVI